jgi:acylphosphatase
LRGAVMFAPLSWTRAAAPRPCFGDYGATPVTSTGGRQLTTLLPRTDTIDEVRRASEGDAGDRAWPGSGVGFRWFVVREAERLGLRGFTRNLPDGRVEVVASGEPDVLQRLVTQLQRGPSGSRVDAVDTSDLESVPEFVSFTVRH